MTVISADDKIVYLKKNQDKHLGKKIKESEWQLGCYACDRWVQARSAHVPEVYWIITAENSHLQEQQNPRKTGERGINTKCERLNKETAKHS